MHFSVILEGWEPLYTVVGVWSSEFLKKRDYFKTLEPNKMLQTDEGVHPFMQKASILEKQNLAMLIEKTHICLPRVLGNDFCPVTLLHSGIIYEHHNLWECEREIGWVMYICTFVQNKNMEIDNQILKHFKGRLVHSSLLQK